MKNLLPSVVLSLFLFTSCYSNKAPEEYEKRETLAIHETLARFDGIQYATCRGRTSTCPQKCGHSGEFAKFTILKYTKFQKNSQYGHKRKQYQIQVSDFNKNLLINIPKIPQGLQQGDEVILNWNHDYVTKNHSSYPIHPLLKIERIP